MNFKNLILIFAALPMFAQADAPTGTLVNFTSPNGVEEACVTLSDMPGATYSEADVKRAKKNCGADMYDNSRIAICPKTWSTSAAVMIYDVTKMNMTGEEYETQHCKGKNKPDEVSTVMKLKFSMNETDTSGTYIPSSQIYYHISRYLDTSVGTPVAVYREIDAKTLYDRVAQKGYAKAAGSKNKAAWSHILNALKNPSSKAAKALYTSDGTKFFGTGLKDLGEGYETELHGLQEGGYTNANKQFQETAAYRALRTEGDLPTAIKEGLTTALKNKTLAVDLVNVSDLQMVFWMREVSEIALLDYMFSQQDRVSNIDFEWKWYWIQDGKVESLEEKSELPRKQMAKIQVPAEIAAFNPVLIQRSHIGDNDAGVKVGYSNFAKSTGQLKNLKHFSAKIYTRLADLNADLQSQGEVFQYLSTQFGITNGEIKQIVTNTSEAFELLKAQCTAGTLRFDLDSPKSFLLNGEKATTLDCANPAMP